MYVEKVYNDEYKIIVIKVNGLRRNYVFTDIERSNIKRWVIVGYEVR